MDLLKPVTADIQAEYALDMSIVYYRANTERQQTKNSNLMLRSKNTCWA